jgi:hypothetical protein
LHLFQHLIKLVRQPNTHKKRPKKPVQRPKQSYPKKHINKKVPFGTFYFGARGARGLAGAFGLAAALGFAGALGLATGAGLVSATGAGLVSTAGAGASTLYGASNSEGLPNKNSLIFVNIMFSYQVFS